MTAARAGHRDREGFAPLPQALDGLVHLLREIGRKPGREAEHAARDRGVSDE